MNQKEKDQTKLLLMAEFVHNNTKNTSKDYTSFELNYKYQPKVSFKDKTDLFS